jgi:AraC-like DNA-binding protein
MEALIMYEIVKINHSNEHFNKYVYQDFILNNESQALGLVVRQAGYLEAGPKYILNPRTLYFYSIIFVSKGTGTFQCLGKSYELKPNTAFFLFPGITHSYQTYINDLFSHWWIDFYGYNSNILVNSLGITPENPIIYNVDLLQTYKNILFESQKSTFVRSLNASCNLYSLFGTISCKANLYNSELYTTEESPPSAFVKGKSFLEANHREDISIDQAAQVAGVSSTHLIKLFKTKLGCSPSQYLAMLRLDSSKKLLLETNISITAVAHSCGFNDSHYFSRFFRKHTGFSPQKLRCQPPEKEV